MVVIVYHSSKEDNTDPNFRKKYVLPGTRR